MFPQEVDQQLTEFSREFGLQTSTNYRESEARSITIVDDQGTSYQLWIGVDDEQWVVHAWDFKDKRAEFPSTTGQLGTALRRAVTEVDEWINQAGHTRSWS